MEKAKPKRKTKNQFQKGNTKGKGFGRPRLTDAQKELQLKSRTQFNNILNQYLLLTLAELNKLYKAHSTPVIDKMIIKALINAKQSGDLSAIDWFTNHILGKQADKSELKLTGGMENTTQLDLKKLSTEELQILLKAANKAEGESEK